MSRKLPKFTIYISNSLLSSGLETSLAMSCGAILANYLGGSVIFNGASLVIRRNRVSELTGMAVSAIIAAIVPESALIVINNYKHVCVKDYLYSFIHSTSPSNAFQLGQSSLLIAVHSSLLVGPTRCFPHVIAWKTT